MSRGEFAMPARPNLLPWIVLAVLLNTMLPGHASDHETVWVFTAGKLPPVLQVAHADRLFVLDDVDQSLKALSFPNPRNEAQARQRAMRMLQSPKGQAVLTRIRHSAEAIAVAWQHGIVKLPAILVDERYVVYGIYNIDAALAQIARYRDGN